MNQDEIDEQFTSLNSAIANIFIDKEYDGNVVLAAFCNEMLQGIMSAHQCDISTAKMLLCNFISTLEMIKHSNMN